MTPRPSTRGLLRGSLGGRVGGRAGRDPVAVGLEEVQGVDGVGQDQDRLDPAFVLAARVAQVGQGGGEERHHRIEPGDGRERAADVEAAHPVLGGGGRVGELATPFGLLPLRGRLGVGGLDRRLDQQLEPGPGDPAVGGLHHPLVDVAGLHRGEVAGLAGHEPGIGDLDLQCLDPLPQPWQPVGQVQGVGHQIPARMGRQAEPAAKVAGENSATSGVPAPPNRRGRSPPGAFNCHARDALGVVEDRMLPRRHQDRRPRSPAGCAPAHRHGRAAHHPTGPRDPYEKSNTHHRHPPRQDGAEPLVPQGSQRS